MKTSLKILLPTVVLLAGCDTVPSTDSVRNQGAPEPERQVVAPQQPAPPPRAVDPRVANLEPGLRAAVGSAQRAARDDGVDLRITSGWRSHDHQQHLLDEAVVRYGSLAEALRWVSTPDSSAHVTGDAVDIGPRDADDWLERNGPRWGLCRVFANEVWHFELATEPGGTCPDLIPDSTYR